MARSTRNVTPASFIGGALGQNGAIDALSLTDAARVRRIAVALPSATQNQTTRATMGPLGHRGIVLGAYVSYTTKPAGGTLSVNVETYDASADAAVALGTVDPELLTNREGMALTMAVANDTQVLEADDTLDATVVADNNTVTAAGVGGVLVVLVLPIEPAANAAIITGTPAGL